MLLLSADGFRWTDPHTWPWIIYVWVVFAFAGWVPSLWRRWRNESAKAWLQVSATIESTHVDAAPKTFAQFGRQSGLPNAILNYTYFTAGARQTGQYSRSLDSIDDTFEFIRDLNGKVFVAQVNPRNPARSVLLESEINRLLNSRTPLSIDQAQIQAPHDLTPVSLRPFIQIFIVLAGIGLFLSFWVHITAIFRPNIEIPSYFWGLHVGIFIVFIPAVLAAQKVVGKTRRSDFWKHILRFAPPWMTYAFYGLFGYAFFNFFWVFLRIGLGKASGNSAENGWRGFSGHWMLFYAASFAILYSVDHSRTATGICISGHRFSSGYLACPILQEKPDSARVTARDYGD